jgi:hypothetical protein
MTLNRITAACARFKVSDAPEAAPHRSNVELPIHVENNAPG